MLPHLSFCFITSCLLQYFHTTAEEIFDNDYHLSRKLTSPTTYDINSPNFVPYTGPTSNTSLLYLHYVAYADSCKEQGISTLRAGDAEIEKDRLNLISTTDYSILSSYYPNKTFSIDASIKWNPSDFAIQEGETYSFSITNTSEVWYDGVFVTDSKGYTSSFNAHMNCYTAFNQCKSYLKKKRRFLSAPWLSVICGIGEYVRPLTAVQPGQEYQTRFLPLDESQVQDTLFFVGDSLMFTAKYSGSLICFANDAYSEYWNNVGIIHMEIQRVSWPPTINNTHTYYDDLLLPACDASISLYANQGNFSDNTTDHSIKCNPNNVGGGWKS